MIAERALTLAGPDAVLVSRPRGVPHVYTGPLTPSGRFARAAGRTVCRAHTRRLTVLPRSERRSSLDPEARRLCARCSARLSDLDPRAGEPSPVHRDQWRREYAEVTRADVAAALLVAADEAEVDAASHLSLLLFGVAGCAQPFHEHARTWPALADLTHGARGRVGAFNTPAAVAAAELDLERLQASNAQAKAERHQVWADREERIRRLGFVNATRAGPR